jgi:hypothetical protein
MMVIGELDTVSVVDPVTSFTVVERFFLLFHRSLRFEEKVPKNNFFQPVDKLLDSFLLVFIR